MENNMEQTARNEGVEGGVDVQEKSQDGKEGKLFTQDEVNGLIQARLARAKEQAGKDAKAEYDRKLEELQARELKLIMKERLDAREMPRELADILTCVSEEDIDGKLDALQKIYGDSVKKAPKGIKVGASASGFTFHEPQGPDPVREAMGLTDRR